MCLLINKPANTTFSKNFYEGVFKKNEDGLGVMYAENGRVVVKKILPKTFEDVEAFIRDEVDGRECSLHFRMQTHGDVDLTNCHPYQVISADEGYELWLMHNGVLHTDNKKDQTKSDTWHYINDYLRPMLLANPTFFLTEAFKEVVGAHIGSGNKFVLMDYMGNVVTVNKDEGVEYEGAWLSNTYAWDSAGKPFKQLGLRHSYGRLYDDDGYDWYGRYTGYSSYTTTSLTKSTPTLAYWDATGNAVMTRVTSEEDAVEALIEYVDYYMPSFGASASVTYMEVEAFMAFSGLAKAKALIEGLGDAQFLADDGWLADVLLCVELLPSTSAEIVELIHNGKMTEEAHG